MLVDVSDKVFLAVIYMMSIIFAFSFGLVVYFLFGEFYSIVFETMFVGLSVLGTAIIFTRE